MCFGVSCMHACVYFSVLCVCVSVFCACEHACVSVFCACERACVSEFCACERVCVSVLWACERVCISVFCACVRACYLQGLHQLPSTGDVGDVDGGAEGVQHLHLLQDVLAARGPDDQQLTALQRETGGERAVGGMELQQQLQWLSASLC